MGSSSLVVFLILLITISSPLLLQIHARDSQFFSKVTNKPTETVTVPEKEQEQQSQQETEQQPEFVPQNQNGYGLYGQENTETKSGVQTHTPGTYASEKYYNNGKNGAQTEEQFWNNNGEKYYSSNGQSDDELLNFDDSFDAEKTRSGETGEAFYNNNNNGVGTEHYTTESQNQKDNTGESYYYNTDRNSQFGSQLGQTETNYNDNRFDSGFTNELNSRFNTYRTGTTQNRGGSGVERQGMSDTRFLENSKYYYDMNQEQNTYNPNYNNNQFGNRAYRSGSNYDNNVYDNSGAEKYEFNTMEEYERSRQNQFDP